MANVASYSEGGIYRFEKLSDKLENDKVPDTLKSLCCGCSAFLGSKKFELSCQDCFGYICKKCFGDSGCLFCPVSGGEHVNVVKYDFKNCLNDENKKHSKYQVRCLFCGPTSISLLDKEKPTLIETKSGDMICHRCIPANDEGALGFQIYLRGSVVSSSSRKDYLSMYLQYSDQIHACELPSLDETNTALYLKAWFLYGTYAGMKRLDLLKRNVLVAKLLENHLPFYEEHLENGKVFDDDQTETDSDTLTESCSDDDDDAATEAWDEEEEESTTLAQCMGYEAQTKLIDGVWVSGWITNKKQK
jgi:hypothetical protein